MIQQPANGKEHVTVTDTPQGAIRKRVLFTLEHMNTEYWGCEWTDSPLIFSAKSVIYDQGEYCVRYSKSMESCNLTPVLSNALCNSFLDNQIIYERLYLAELENNALIWENEQLVHANRNTQQKVDEYLNDSRLDEELIEEYTLMQRIYSQENEQLVMENRRMKEKLDFTNDVITNKDLQIQNLRKELDEMEIINKNLKARLSEDMTDQIKMKNERLTSKVAYLESKYIDSVLGFKKAESEISMLNQKDKLIKCLLPRDFGESVGLFFDFVMLFTRLKSKCMLLSGLVEFYENLKNERHSFKMDGQQLMVNFDRVFMIGFFKKGAYIFDEFSKAVMHNGHTSEIVNRAAIFSKNLESRIDSIIDSFSNDDFFSKLCIEDFILALGKLIDLNGELIQSAMDYESKPKSVKSVVSIIHTNLCTLSSYLTLLEHNMDPENDNDKYDSLITVISKMQLRLMTILDSDNYMKSSSEMCENLWICSLEIEKNTGYILELVKEEPFNNGRLKNILNYVISTNADEESLPDLMKTLENLMNLLMKNRSDISSCKSDYIETGHWENMVCQCQTRYSDVSSLEKQISLLESELASQSILVSEAENRVKEVIARSNIRNNKPVNDDSKIVKASMEEAVLLESRQSQEMEELHRENQRLKDIIRNPQDLKSLNNNGSVLDLLVLEDAVKRLWNENIQLKLNLSKWYATQLIDNCNEGACDVTKVGQLRRIQRKIRLEKLNAMRIPIVKATSKNCIIPRKHTDQIPKITQEVEDIMKNLGTCHHSELPASESGQLRSRVYLKRKLNENNHEPTIKKLVMPSESTFYRRLLF